MGAVGHKQTLLIQLELGDATHDNKKAVITSLFQRLGAQSRYGSVV
jgi:methylmalonyl-CoA mutase cobalamin-binding subunit